MRFIKLPLVVLSLFALSISAKAQDGAPKTKTDIPAYDAVLSAYHYNYTEPVAFYDIASQGQNLKMAYVFLKGQDDKPTVTLLHGKNFNADYWSQTAKHLNSQGYNVFIPDQIGFGKSSKPMQYQYSFPVLAMHTKNLLRSLGIEKSIIVGHSMGGMLASRYALMYPESTEKLVLINPIGLENYLQFVQYKDTDFFFDIEKAKTPEKIRAYQSKNYYDGAWSPTYDAMTHFMIGQMKGPDAAQIAWVNALTYDMIFTQPVITEFQNITVPTTLILGTRDRTGPGRAWKKYDIKRELGRYDRLGKEVQALLPSTTLYTLENTGHLPQIENFETFIQFFDQILKK